MNTSLLDTLVPSVGLPIIGSQQILGMWINETLNEPHKIFQTHEIIGIL